MSHFKSYFYVLQPEEVNRRLTSKFLAIFREPNGHCVLLLAGTGSVRDTLTKMNSVNS